MRLDFMMKQMIRNFMKQHHMVNENETIIVATSGGPDSMALLHLLCQMREELGLALIAVTVDHQLRGKASEEDVAYVASVCNAWGITHESVRVDVRTYVAQNKLSTQVAARILRYEALHRMMKKYRASSVAMGHHGDDQIETMLMSLTRATTLNGMLGIPVKRPFHEGHIIRPLLCVTKAMIEQYCENEGIQPQIDLSNFDPSYERNNIRKTIVPPLKERYDQLHRTVQRYTESVQEDERYLQAEAKKMFRDVCTIRQEKAEIAIQLDLFMSYPVSLQRRCYRLTLDYLYKQPSQNLSHVHEGLFMELLQSNIPNKRIQFPENVYIEKAYRTLYVYKESTVEKAEQELLLEDMEQTRTLSNGDRVSLTYIDNLDAIPNSKFTYVCKKEEIVFPLHIRTRRDGDRMTYNGLDGTKKLKDIFMDEKVPRHLRDDKFIVTDHTGEILWLIGIRKNEKINKKKQGLFIMLTYEQHGKGNEEDNYA